MGKKFLLIILIIVVIVIVFLLIKTYSYSNQSLTYEECINQNGTIRTQELDMPEVLREILTCKLWEINIGRIWDLNCICSCCKPLF